MMVRKTKSMRMLIKTELGNHFGFRNPSKSKEKLHFLVATIMTKINMQKHE